MKRELKDAIQRDLDKELENFLKKHVKTLIYLEKDFEREKQIKKEKFSMQISKFMKSQKSFDEMDESEEKRELAV